MALLLLRSTAKTFRGSVSILRNLSSQRNAPNSISGSSLSSPIKEPKEECCGIHKSVFISQSNDIFTNLALEDWLYKNFDFQNHHVMLLWRNDPCVVIGRHQNPWIEADVEFLNNRGINIARRNSGGGTVYHDKGNLNISFFTPRERYNRKHNLQLIERTLRREWNLNIEINQREDLILDSKYKVSGTAAKLGSPNAYHHCTLMVHVNRDDLSFFLHKQEEDRFDTTALQSMPAEVQNISDGHTEVPMERLMERLGWEYLRTAPLSLADAGWDHVRRQNGFHMINPTDEWFPGLSEIRDEFTSWEWKYGRTPQFTMERRMKAVGAEGSSIRMNIEKGVVTPDVSLVLPEGVWWGETSGLVPIQTTIVGQKFSPSLFQLVEKAVLRQGIPFVNRRSASVAAH